MVYKAKKIHFPKWCERWLYEKENMVINEKFPIWCESENKSVKLVLVASKIMPTYRWKNPPIIEE
jgi:hypothetical protein